MPDVGAADRAPTSRACALPTQPPQGGLEFDALEARLAQLERELLELNANSDRLHRSYNELLELQVRS